MTDIAALTDLIEPEASALGLSLVRVGMFGGVTDATLQVMAERPDTRQLTLDDCAALSRRLSDVLDRLEGTPADPISHAYRLEVSSPGIDRPLTRAADYGDWAGHLARVKLAEKVDGRKVVDGVLGGIAGDVVTMVREDGDTMTVTLAQIASAKLLLTDKLIAATAPLAADDADEIEDEEPDDGN